jgi:hypothetical protein
MFDSAYRADVDEIDQSLERMIWRIVSKFAELSGAPVTLSRSAAYAVYDGLFQHALSRHLADDPDAADVLEQDVQRLLYSLVPGN